MKKLSKSFCWRPFTQVIFNQNTHKPCCFFQGKFDNNTEINKEVRNAILENKWHDGCKICKNLEENKNTKKRSFRFLYDGIRDANLVLQNKFSAKNIEISVDNSCNFACITCNSGASSKWLSENKKMEIPDENKNYSFDFSFYKNHDLWENADTCIIYGGEPLYSKNSLNLLKFLIENKLSKKLSLTFYTNGSILNDEIAELLENFKSCKINFSVDSIYERFHIIRWPGNYEIVKNNFKKISKIKNTSVNITYTYSILNATNFVEDYNIIKNELIDDIRINVVNNPKIYAARNLPENVKDKLINSYFKEKDIDRNIIDIAIGELQMPSYINSLHELIKQLKIYDSYRKTDSSILFPQEVWALSDK
jgi:MoaA/NifB/PqqE/SkfB family radical SAM enzyme